MRAHDAQELCAVGPFVLVAIPMYRPELSEALRQAFNKDDFTDLLRGMDLVLEHISTAGDYTTVVNDVLDEAKRNGWMEGLIDAALAKNPGNRTLRAAAGGYYKSIYTDAPLASATQAIRQLSMDVGQDIHKIILEIEHTLYGTRGNGGGLLKKVNEIQNTLAIVMAKLDKLEEKVDQHIEDGPEIFSPRVARFFLVAIFVMLLLLLGMAAWPLLPAWGRALGV